MRLLAEHGADPKLPNALGITPLMVAAGLDYWEGEAQVRSRVVRRPNGSKP